MTPKPRSTSPSREEEDKQGCLELETEECASECKLKGDAASAKCRRGCLEQRCPDSNRLDLAKESADPGALRCERCRVEAKDFCASSCGVGLIAGELGRSTGLENLGCVKVCVVATCQKSCGMSF